MRRLLVALCLALIAFPLAMLVAGWMDVAQGQGLAGGAIVVGYGLLGALFAFAAAWTVPQRWLPKTLVVLALPAVLVCALMLLGYLHSRAQLDTHLQQAYEQLPPFVVTIEPGPTLDGLPTERFEADWHTRQVSLWTPSGICRAPLEGEQAVLLLTAVRNAEAVTYQNPTPCAGQLQHPVGSLSFSIQEATAGVSKAQTQLSERCLQRFAALAAPGEAAQQVVSERKFAPQCTTAEP